MTSRKKTNNHTKNTNHAFNKTTGLYDPNGLYDNPLTNQPYQNLYADEVLSDKSPKTYTNLAKIWSDKIVYHNKDAIIGSIANNQITLATAGTGVGKTILVPRMALHAFDYKEKVICTIPKKLPTRENAQFIAQCMDVKIGEHVGYFYQGENNTNKNGIETKLTFTTTGSLISSMVGSDPLLSNYKCVIIDEAHERSVETDLLLLLLKKACMKRRDLKVVIMSATIDLDKFRNYFPKSAFKFGEIDAGSETTYPVSVKWIDRPKDWKLDAIDITMRILKKTKVGDIMIFVKAKGDAVQLCASLEKAMNDFRKTLKTKSITRKLTTHKSATHKSATHKSATHKSATHKSATHKSATHKSATHKSATHKSATPKPQIIPPEYEINPYCAILDGKTTKKDADLATNEHLYKSLRDSKGYPYTRKIVITTNVAESSITVNGIVFIIDAGLEFTASYDPSLRVRKLLESNIAQSAVKQRKGRAGRTQPGYCFHLYNEREYSQFEHYPIPAIEKQDITMNILDLLRMKEVNTIEKMRVFLDQFISPPHEKFIINALNTLYALGAITDMNTQGKITPMGLALCKFRALPPNFARSIIASHFYGCSRSVCDIIALATVADGRLDSIFIKYREDKKKSKDQNKKEFSKHKNIMKSYEHEYGDYMSILNAYRMYMKYAIGMKEKQITQLDTTLESTLPTESLPDIPTDPSDDETGEDVKSPPSVNKWCKEHYINARKMSLVRKLSGDLYRTLQTTLKPYQANRPFKELSKADKHRMSIVEVNEVLDSLDTLDIRTPSELQSIQSGGFIRQINKEEELEKLEPNVKRFPKEEDNIMMVLGIGNFVNLGKLKKGFNDIYESCFAEKKQMAKINMDSFIKGNPPIIMYHELFMSNANTKFLKLNMVNKIPNNVWEKLKQDYGKFIKYCI
jgi:HrpA-like RNA helicase